MRLYSMKSILTDLLDIFITIVIIMLIERNTKLVRLYIDQLNMQELINK